MEEQLIYREEVIALLLGISDIARSPGDIETLLGGGGDGEEAEADEG
jgi:hypothetical protein